MPDIHEILREHWGYSSFRPLQEDIIRSVIAGNDSLALLPTGGGKSICFQVPGLYLSGVCLVISPLIALMKDQVGNLRRRGIQAAAIYSGMRFSEVDAALDNCIYGQTKFLYVSPERLQTSLFIERLKKMKVNLLAVDESHCISQWGYDFRPPYLLISDIRQYIPDAPVLALTATATAQVVDDIQEKLGFRKKNVFRKSFARPNLVYAVLEEEDKPKKLAELLRASAGSAVVYVRNRKRTRLIAEYLQEQGFSAQFYHAGLDTDTRSRRQDEWIQGRSRIIVATNAFGMGIDKPDVRLVVHTDLPDTLEAYFQEAGRAGRDEKKAYAMVLYNAADLVEMEKNLEDAYPDPDIIRRCYEAIGNYLELAEGSGEGQTFSLELGELLHRFQLPPKLFFQCIGFLERGGYMRFSETDNAYAKVYFHNEDIDDRHLAEKEVILIKTILRSYEGVYDQFVRINEKQLGEKTEMSAEEVLKMLQRLHRQDVLSFSPPKTGFTVTYVQERVPLSRLSFPKEIYRLRKEVAAEKLHAVLRYVQRRDKCRSRLLLEYFGDREGQACGQCDVCRGQLQNQDVDVQYERFLEVLRNLDKEHIPLDELVDRLPALTQHSHALLRWAADNGLITLHPDRTITVNRKKLDRLW